MYENQTGQGRVSEFLLYRTVCAEPVEASRGGQSVPMDLLNDAILPIVQQLQPGRENLSRRRRCWCGRWYGRVVGRESVVTEALFA